MKIFIKNIAAIPFIGKVFSICVAIYQLPKYYDRIDHIENKTSDLQSIILDVNHLTKIELPERFEFGLSDLRSLVFDINHLAKIEIPERIEKASLTKDQIDNLVASLSDLNKRILNFEQSIPVALRNVARDGSMFDTALTALRQKIDCYTSARDDENKITSYCDGLAESVSYLLKRVEFVRRELMFEMRYGAGSVKDTDQPIKVEILSKEKLEVMRLSDSIKVNLGCGHVPLDGYLNIDCRKLPGVDIIADAEALPFNFGELSEGFSAHFLEHFPKEQLVRSIIPYYVNLLKHGGIFRAIVPDADAMIDAYKNGEYNFDRLREITFGGQDYDGDFHYTMLSPESLREILLAAGLQEVQIIDRNRENGGCKEFEIVARRV